jgi:hypothetical protein
VAQEPVFFNRLAAVIGADGRIARGYQIESVEVRGENEYVITWRIDLRGGEAKSNFVVTIGSEMEEPVEPGFATVGLAEGNYKSYVKTYDVTGKPARRPFHIGVFRDR